MPQRYAIRDPRDEPALNRLSAQGGKREWNAMSWFVLLAKKDLAQLSNGDLLSLREEALAILRTLGEDRGAKLPTMEELSRLQRDILKYLNGLVARHDVTLGPFCVKIEINLPRTKSEEGGWISDFVNAGHMTGTPGKKQSTSQTYLAPISVRHRVSLAQNLQYEFARRLEKYADAIKRCLYCGHLFLQLRSSAKHCGRTCQSRAIMKKIRVDEKAKAQAKRAIRKARIASAKGGKRHGKTKR